MDLPRESVKKVKQSFLCLISFYSPSSCAYSCRDWRNSRNKNGRANADFATEDGFWSWGNDNTDPNETLLVGVDPYSVLFVNLAI